MYVIYQNDEPIYGATDHSKFSRQLQKLVANHVPNITFGLTLSGKK